MFYHPVELIKEEVAICLVKHNYVQAYIQSMLCGYIQTFSFSQNIIFYDNFYEDVEDIIKLEDMISGEISMIHPCLG